jgi:EAL domain-containing protein (putative c-di-GMP-specific phosphodiesterase class I)
MISLIDEVATVMGKKTVAEFVENSDIELKEIGVHYSQGYGIARPYPIAELAGNMQTKSSSKN